MRISRILATTATAGLLALASAEAEAAAIAVFGDNGVDDFYAGLGHTATLVTDGEIATAGFLDAFDAFVYTRDGSSFGASLSAGAAANVQSFVTGNIVLFNFDLADGIPGDVNLETLLENALNHVLDGSGKGFIAELGGAVAALDSNGDGFTPLGLVAGSAGAMNQGAGDSDQDLTLTPAGTGHAVTAGVGFPYNPPDVEFGALVSGVDESIILARFNNETPAIIATGASQDGGGDVPEPATLGLLGLALAGLGYARRRAA